nr:hypothetical protein [Tanacetum cinerariifolium]
MIFQVMTKVLRISNTLTHHALDSKLLSINSINFQRLDKKEQEVKIFEEQPAERRNQHLSITPEMESDEVTESNAENLLPILSEYEVALEDKRECTVPISENFLDCDNRSDILFDSNNDDLSSDDESFEDIEYVDASVISSVEENIDHQEQEEINLEEISQVQDVVLHEKLFSINNLIANIESLKDNPTPVCMFNSSTSIPILEESDNSLSLPEFETFCDHLEETRSGNTAHANYSLLEYVSFCFENEPHQERLINLVENDNSDSSNDPLLEEVDLFLS